VYRLVFFRFLGFARGCGGGKIEEEISGRSFREGIVKE